MSVSHSPSVRTFSMRQPLALIGAFRPPVSGNNYVVTSCVLLDSHITHVSNHPCVWTVSSVSEPRELLNLVSTGSYEGDMIRIPRESFSQPNARRRASPPHDPDKGPRCRAASSS